MIQQYVGRCERLQRKPDAELLGPALAVLQRQNKQAEEPSE